MITKQPFTGPLRTTRTNGSHRLGRFEGNGVFRGDGLTITQIARGGHAAGGGDVFGLLSAGPVLNDTGAVAFGTSLFGETNNDIQVSWNATAGQTNVVQASAKIPGGFTDISGNIVIPGTGQVATNFAEHSGATQRPARVYRVRLAP
jgi:hypothetical protein